MRLTPPDWLATTYLSPALYYLHVVLPILKSRPVIGFAGFGSPSPPPAPSPRSSPLVSPVARLISDPCPMSPLLSPAAPCRLAGVEWSASVKRKATFSRLDQVRTRASPAARSQGPCSAMRIAKAEPSPLAGTLLCCSSSVV